MGSGEGHAQDEPDEDVVITPGGPRPAHTVHPVGPGERLRQLPDGSFVVEPDPHRTVDDEDEEGEDR